MIRQLLILFSFLISFQTWSQNLPTGVITKIAFGSCNLQWSRQRIWNSVIENQPQLWIWLGDNIYADTENMDEMDRLYQRQRLNVNYKKLLQTCPVIGTWDDHDYGSNNVGKNYPEKRTSQSYHLDFFNVPSNSPRRTQEGVYQSYDLGEGSKTIKIILLDTRYFREDPGPESDMLGETQWKWLETTLQNDEAEITIIGTSIQFSAGKHVFEEWLNFPKSYERMKKTIAQSGKKHIFFISGDRHLSEVSKIDNKPSYPLFDFTSSGLTHSNFTMKDYENSTRVSPLCVSQNFGIISINWDAKLIELECRGKGNFLYYSFQIPFSELE